MVSVYIIYSRMHDRYYVGQTKDVAMRLISHNKGYNFSSAPYIPWDLVLQIEKETRRSAMILERKIKNLNRSKLLEFIKKYSNQGPGRSEAGPGADRSVSTPSADLSVSIRIP